MCDLVMSDFSTQMYCEGSKRRQKGAPSKNTRKGEVVHEHYRFKAQHGNSSSKDGHHGEERGK